MKKQYFEERMFLRKKYPKYMAFPIKELEEVRYNGIYFKNYLIGREKNDDAKN